MSPLGSFLFLSFPSKKRGRLLLVGMELDRKVQQYLRAIRESGGAVNSAITLAAAKGITLKTNRTLQAEFGGHVVLTKDWAKTLLQRMEFVKEGPRPAKARIWLKTSTNIKQNFSNKYRQPL